MTFSGLPPYKIYADSFNLIFFLYLQAGIIVFIPALFSWRRRGIAGVSSLFLTMFFMSALLFLGAIEMAFVDLNVKKNILVLEDLAYTSCVTTMFVFVDDYFFKGHWLRPNVRRLLWACVAILLLLDATNFWHGLVWTGYLMGPAGTNLMYAQPGPWYLAIISIFDLVGVFVLGSLGVLASHRTGWERWRAVSIVAGMVVPFLTPLVMLLISDKTISSNILPMIYAVSGLFISWVVFEDQHRQLQEKTFDLRRAQDNLALKLVGQSQKMVGLFDMILVGSQQMRTDELLASLLEKISSLMDGAVVCLYTQNDQTLRISGNFGLSHKQNERVKLIPVAWLPVAPDARIVPNIPGDSGLPGAFFQAGFNSLLARWIQSGEMPENVLVAFWMQPRDFTIEELALFYAIADEARVILENARMRAKAIDQALFQERHRISRDLHDTITQSLNSIVLTAEVTGVILEKSDTVKLKKILASLQTDAQQALKELRLLLFELRLESLGDTDLMEALQDRIDLVEKKAGLDVKLTVTGCPEWSTWLTEDLYYIATEALNNSLKHAFATRVEISMERTAECVILKIRDDGRGFQPNQANRGFGLRGMAERAARLGGCLEIESSPGQGTLITVTMPDGIGQD